MFFVIETFVRFFSVYRCCHMTHSRHVSTNPFAVQWSVGYLLGLCSDNCAQPAPELLPAAVLEEILQKLKIKPWNFPAKHSCCISWTTWDFYFSKHAPLYGHGLRSFEFFCNTFPEVFVDGRTLFDFPFVWEWATVRIFPFEWIVSNLYKLNFSDCMGPICCPGSIRPWSRRSLVPVVLNLGHPLGVTGRL